MAHVSNWLISLVLVFVVIPLVDVAFYAWLCWVMSKRDILAPPYITYFFLFAHAGIWFLLLLTAVLWGWSGMSSIGFFYLMFISPFPAVVFALVLHGRTPRFSFSSLGVSFVYGLRS